MSIQIIKTGIFSSVQDQGRRGMQRYGIPVAGCMDRHAAAIANLMCGNSIGDAVLEFTYHGAMLLFHTEHLVCFTGGGSRVFGDGRALPFDRAMLIPAGTSVELGYADIGCRTYMAVGGGINIAEVLGSRSMYRGIGPERLEPRQELATGTPSSRSESMRRQINGSGLTVARWGSIELLEHFTSDLIRVTRGPDWHMFTPASRHSFLNSQYKLSNTSDRMGSLLEGECLSLASREEMISTSVCTGTVQVIPDGSPLVLMADAQTIGGYPRIGQVIESDLGLLAQKRPGDTIRFREVSHLVAEELYINRRRELARLERSLKVKFSV